MSAGDEGPFARWSRRKQATRKADAASSDKVADAADSTIEANVSNSERQGGQIPTGDSAAVEPSEPLPSLESLTIESDLTAFLREGIPESLKRAALRKMWSLDPAIRDHVGLAECDWDFNRPDSIPGFGPIGAAPVAPDFFSRPAAGEAADPEIPAPSTQPPEIAEKPAENARADDASETPPPQESAGPDDRALPDGPTDTVSRIAGRHGGALPRE